MIETSPIVIETALDRLLVSKATARKNSLEIADNIRAGKTRLRGSYRELDCIQWARFVLEI